MKRRRGEEAKRRESGIGYRVSGRQPSAAGKVPGLAVTRHDWLTAGILFLAVFLVTLFTMDAYGPTYDEPHYISAGHYYVQWWGRVVTGDTSALSRDAIAQAWHYNHEHPPLQKVASGLSQAAFGRVLPGMTAMRLPSALWFALTVGALYLFLLGVWGRAGAVFAALAFATLPRVFAHAHFIALDMPITAWFFITAALTAVALERDSWGWSVVAGTAFGLALAAKVNAFFLPILLLPWGLIWYRARWRKLLAVLLIGPAVFFLSWPWLWIAPVAHLRGYLAFHFQHAAYNVWYLGKLWHHAPWHYPFVMTAVTTPVFTLLLALGGIALAWPRRGGDPRKALLLLGLLVALAPNALPNTPKYNGVRLFLPAFPFLAALAGGAFAWTMERDLQRNPNRSPQMRTLITVLLTATLLSFGVTRIIDLHPYQLAYYNELAGGTRGAAARGFETIYWGQVFQDGVGFLNKLPASSRVLVIPKGVIYLLTFQQQGGALRPDIQFTGDESEASRVDLVLFQGMQSDYTDLCWTLVRNEKPAYALEAEGAPVLLAFDRPAVAAALSRLNRNSAAPAPNSNPSASSETNSPTR